jgi:A/G-specific adenine glycosylase
MASPNFPTRQLLTWFRRNQRDLPWRRDRRPYTVWVSEVMLQQTRVDQAEGYYRRFLEAFPDMEVLARSPLEKVLKIWEGLGYYSRARYLHQAARRVVKDYGGQLPSTFQELTELPGIGRSTAGAVLSLACGQAYPILDGNVKRVLIRFYRIQLPPGQKETLAALWRQAEAILPPNNPGPFNEALMELGALVCRPRDPNCIRCPLRGSCRAFIKGEAGALPLKNPPRKIPHFDVTAAVVRKGGRILITRRPEKGLLGGLWNFPVVKRNPMRLWRPA